MNENCKECQLSEWRERCYWTMSIGVFLEHLMETHSIPVIHECPFHYDLEEDKYDLEGDEKDE